jgi:putative Mg2+ transporter-C (MgtC) family protein
MPLTTELLSPPSLDQFLNVVLRLIAAAVTGALLGAEREAMGKAAGLRTHMLVALGGALFVIVATEHEAAGDISRVIQGVAAGIGFIGAGTILKHAEKDQVTGLTTAASLWLTAAIGVAAGTGTIWLALGGGLFAWIVLRVLLRAEKRSDKTVQL